MAFGRTCSRTAGCAESTCSNAWDVVAAGALKLGQVDRRAMPLIELVIELISWAFHPVKYVEAPVNHMEVISVLICTNVAHSSVTTTTDLKSTNIRVLIFVVDTAC